MVNRLRLLLSWLALAAMLLSALPAAAQGPGAGTAPQSVASAVTKLGLANSPWPMFRHDLQHTGRSPYLGPQTPELKWIWFPPVLMYSSPAIGADGTIYVGADPKNLYAINPSGSLRWSFPTGASVYSSPAIGADGTIYVGSYDKKLYAINPDGSLKWSFTTGGIIVYSSPAIGADGTIYVGSYDKKLYAINPDGSLKWSYTTGGSTVSSSPAIGADGTVYVGSEDHKLYAINPDGSLKWSYLTGGAAFSPAIGADGTIYVGSGDNNLYAINPAGTLKWSFTPGQSSHSPPAIGADGTIYVGSADNNLYAINPNGSLKWSFLAGSWVYPSPAIGADGTIYVIPISGVVYALNADGSLKWSFNGPAPVEASPSIGAGGMLFVASRWMGLYAIGEAPPPVPVAVTQLGTGNDADACAGGAPAIIQIVDPQTGQPMTVKVGGYEATLTYPGNLVNVLEVRLKPPFDTGDKNIDNAGGKTTFTGIATAGALAPIDPVAFLTLRLTGSVLDTAQATLTFNVIVDVDGFSMAQQMPTPQLTFKRGDAKADGVINIADVLFMAQFLAGLRGVGIGLDKVNPVNAASLKDDGACDKLTIADVLVLAQYLAGLRNPDMTPKAFGQPPPR